MDDLNARLAAAVGAEAVIEDRAELFTYRSDGLASLRGTPRVAVLPGNAAEVSAVVRLCAEAAVPFVARGSGTGLSGGAVPVEGGVLIVLSRMRRIFEVDLDNARVVLEPGVTNAEVSLAVAGAGYYYAPDPSSGVVCSIGGNVAENSGGAHCLKHGFTTNHVTALDVVLPDGSLVELGAPAYDTPGYDLVGSFVGSEGTLGIAVRIAVRVLRRPEAVVTLLAGFPGTDAAGEAVSAIIAAGILPSAIEMMDTLALEAVERAVHPNYPRADAVLIVELDGAVDEVGEALARVRAICEADGGFSMRVAADDRERALLWKGRKAAFAAAGRLSPGFYVQDGVVPRTALPVVLARIAELSRASGLGVANVFHAGDGNLHPLVLFDPAVPGESERAAELGAEILRVCLEHGGSITGEHGIGLDKKRYLPEMFGPGDLEAMYRLRCAFDPSNLANPGKVFPTPRLCGEVPGPYREHPLERAGVAERW